MFVKLIGALTLAVVVALGGGGARAEETGRPGVPKQSGAADERGRRLVEGKLAALTGGAGREIAADRKLVPVRSTALSRAFPGHLFYVLRFQQYPVGLVPPEPLRANNLFVVRPDEAVEHLTDGQALEAFFRAALSPVKTTSQAREAARAWLRLSEELHQDGFLAFAAADKAPAVTTAVGGGYAVTARARVRPEAGNRGEIRATLTFGADGKLQSVAETDDLKQGIRPICQATKLLDPDPVVRGMAEQSLLVLGRAAKEYLDAQRAAASPELRGAIDRIWARIVAEGR
ncbi:MAG TPA: hypothetical protein VGW35_19080 [Methylomirabilota bacterium]|jgi:hypothetical protein|nr:hypothetical protein [Methylomirabilota bacterium]